jgi:hypothetical protein
MSSDGDLGKAEKPLVVARSLCYCVSLRIDNGHSEATTLELGCYKIRNNTDHTHRTRSWIFEQILIPNVLDEGAN